MVKSNNIIKRIICLTIIISIIITSDMIKLYKNNVKAAEPESALAFLYFKDNDDTIYIDSPENAASSPVVVTGEGSYDVFFDVTSTGNDFVNGINLAGIQVVNGETLFPGYIIDIESLEINDINIDIVNKGNTYGSGNMTNFDLYNSLRYEDDIIKDSTARTVDGTLDGAISQLIPSDYLAQQIKSVHVKFNYIKPAASAGLTPLPAGSDNFNVISTQPVAKYTFDNSDGIELNGNAKISSGALVLPAQEDGTATSGNYAKIADLTGTDFSAGITLTADIYVTGNVLDVPVFSFGSSDLRQIYSFSNSFKSMDYIYGISNNNTSIEKPYSWEWYSKEINQKRWDTITVTISDSQTIIYFDGIAIQTSIGDSSIKESLSSASENYLGKLVSGSSAYNFSGSIDNVAIYNTVLTADEVTALSVVAGTYGTESFRSTQPLNVTAEQSSYTTYDGDIFNIKVTATGGQSEDYKYKWYYKDKAGTITIVADGASGNRLQLNASSDMNDKSYFCEVTCGDETTSSGEIRISVGNYIYYDANGGYDAPDKQQKNYGTKIVLSSKSPQRDGYNFNGWSSTKDGLIAAYQPGNDYLKNETITLYAIWSKKAEATATPMPTLKPTATPKPTTIVTTLKPVATLAPTLKPTATPVSALKPTATPKPTLAPTAAPASTKQTSDTYSTSTAIRTDINSIRCSTKYLTVKSGGWQKAAVKISWNKCKTAYRYELYRSEGKNSVYKKLKTWNSEVTKYTDKKVKKGTTYSYKVRAYGGTPTDSYTGNFSPAAKIVVSSTLKKPQLKYKIKNSAIYVDFSKTEGDNFYIQFKKGSAEWKVLVEGKIKKYPEGLKIDIKKSAGTFYLRMRSSIKVNGKTVYSKWSSKIGFTKK